ncbi:MAG: hypothetical protein ACP5UM_09510, partial [Anaerolineae bacterium]
MQRSAQDRAGSVQGARPALDLLDMAWRGVASPWSAAGLAAAGCLLLLAVALIPQAPVAPSEDPVAYAAWIASLPPWWQARVGGLEGAGLTRLFRTTLFRLYATFLGLHLAVAGAQRASDAFHAWRTARRLPNGLEGLGRAPLESPVHSSALREGGWLPLARWEEGDARSVALWRVPWDVLAYVGGLALLAGAVLAARWGWSARPFPLAPGQPIVLQAGGQALAVRLEAVWLQRAGSPLHAGRLAFSDPRTGEPLGTGMVWAGWPLHARGFWLRLTGASPLVTVQARDKESHPLGVQGFPTGAADEVEVPLFFTEDRPEQTFAVPSQRLSGRLVQVAGGGEPRYRLEVYRGSEARPSLVAEVSASGVVAMDDLDLVFLVGQYGWFVAHRHPGAALTVCGWVFLLAGAVAAGRGFGFLLVREAEGEGKVSVPSEGLGWTAEAVERFAHWAGAWERGWASPKGWLLDAVLLLVGMAGAASLPEPVAAAGLPSERLPAWAVLRAGLVLAGWMGLALSLVPALDVLRGTGGGAAEAWAVRLQEAGSRWLTAGLAVGGLAQWLHTGSFWGGGLWQAWPAALWAAGMGSQFLAWSLGEGGQRRVSVALGLVAWVLGATGAVLATA